MTELYNTAILRYAAEMPRVGKLGHADVTVTEVSRICGSKLTIDVAFDGQGAIADFAQTPKACALGQAACSVVGANVVGETAESFAPVVALMEALLAGEKVFPNGKWGALEMFRDAADYKSRHGSIMLPFRAVTKAFAARGE